MVGRVTSAVGLVLGGLVTIFLGYSLTLMAYQDAGPVVIFYYGRYYGGIAAMIVGGVLILVGIVLPIVWPSERQKKFAPVHGRQFYSAQPFPKDPATLSPESPRARSIELKLKGISMQSTGGAEAIQILQLLSLQKGMKRLSLSDMLIETGLDKSSMKKAVSLLVDLDLVKRDDLAYGEGYMIPTAIENEVTRGLRKVGDRNDVLQLGKG